MPSSSTPLRRSSARSIAKALSIGAANQAISSATNFLLGIYLLHILPPEEFGLYGIAFALILLFVAAGGALFLTQMVVHMPEKPPEQRPQYAANILAGLAGALAFTVLAAAAVLVFVSTFSIAMSDHLDMAFAALAGFASFLLKDFFVKHAYAIQKEAFAVATNISVAAGVLLLLLSHHLFEQSVDATRAVWILSTANAMGAFCGLLLDRLPLLSVTRLAISQDVRAFLVPGAWASGLTLIGFLRGQAITFITAFLSGPVGVAHLNAGRLFLSPISMAIPVVSQSLLPRMAEMRAKNLMAMFSLAIGCVTALTILTIAYGACLFIGFDYLFTTGLGSKYQPDELLPIALAFCALTLLHCVRNGQDLILQSAKRFRSLTIANGVSAALAVPCVFVMTARGGVVYGVLALILAELLVVLLLLAPILQEHRRCASPATDGLI